MAGNDQTKKPGEDAVGYGKPPKHTRFKKGRSGNPKGRPKGTENLATAVDRELREKVVINEGGRRKTVTKLVAAVKQLVNKVLTGDLGAWRPLLVLLQIFQQQLQVTATPTARLDDADLKVLLEMLEQFESGFKGRENQ